MITGWEEAVAVLLAGVAAGTINAVVGSGSLITFPTLLAFGVPPVTANVSNNVGIVTGSLSAVVGYRKELAGQRPRVLRYGAASLVGSVAGAVLLLVYPGAFAAVVPVLIAIGVLLVLLGPRLQARLAARSEGRGGLPEHGAGWVWPAILGTGVYGGYFGAAQGVLLLGVLGVGLPDTLQRNNGLKNVLAFIVNLVAAVVFLLIARDHIDWLAVLMIAVGSLIGGQLGSVLGRRLPPIVFRVVIAVVGVVAIVALLF